MIAVDTYTFVSCFPDRGAIHFHTRRTFGSSHLWRNRSTRAQFAHAHSTTITDGSRHNSYRNGTRVQGKIIVNTLQYITIYLQYVTIPSQINIL